MKLKSVLWVFRNLYVLCGIVLGWELVRFWIQRYALQLIKYNSFKSEIAFIISKSEAVPMKLKCCKNVLKGEAVAVSLWSQQTGWLMQSVRE